MSNDDHSYLDQRDTLSPEENNWHFEDGIFKRILWNKTFETNRDTKQLWRKYVSLGLIVLIWRARL